MLNDDIIRHKFKFISSIFINICICIFKGGIALSNVICVYSSSSSTIEKVYFEAAEALGKEIAIRQDVMLYGGGMNGLMGATARAVHQQGGKVIGIIPEALNLPGVVYENCDELIISKDLRTRKAIMDAKSDAFIALPGGYGTLEEILEIITLKQLNYHHKPIVILNIDNFYQDLLNQFEALIDQQFAKPECRSLYFVTDNIAKALAYIDNYQPKVLPSKWISPDKNE